MTELNPAEQAAAEVIQTEIWAAPRAELEAQARAVVAAVQPIIEAEALDDAAEALAQVAAVKAREPYITSQRLRFGLTSGAQRLRDRAAAVRAERQAEGRADQ